MAKRNPRGVILDGETIRAARDALRLTQDTLAEKADVSKRTIERLEKGARATYETAGKLAEALGVDYESLVSERHKKGERRRSKTTASGTSGQIRSSVLFDVYKEYKGLRKALHAVWHDPLDSFDDELRDEYRRDVLHFWEMIAMIVTDDPTLEEPLRDRYRDQVSVWERLKLIQIRATAKVIRRRQPKLDGSKITEWATREVSTSNVEGLYNRWKSHRRSHFRNNS